MVKGCRSREIAKGFMYMYVQRVEVKRDYQGFETTALQL